MEITEVRIKLMEEPSERLQAFCSITFDNCFVIRDLKIIEGTNGPFVAMPSRKLTAHCPQLRLQEPPARAATATSAAAGWTRTGAVKDADGRAKLYADIAHPINSACREMIQDRVIEEFHDEQWSGPSSPATSRATTTSIWITTHPMLPRPATQKAAKMSRPTLRSLRTKRGAT